MAEISLGNLCTVAIRRLLGMKVTTIRWSDNGARGGWFVTSGRGGLRFARLGSQPAPQFGREQLTPKLVEIGCRDDGCVHDGTRAQQQPPLPAFG
jgi:hypothetical protein